MNTVPVLVKLRPKADWLALRFTVCAALFVIMLKNATSEEPGGLAGLGVVALLTVDQELAEFQPRVGVPVPSQKMFAAGAGAGKHAPVKTTIPTRSIRSAKDRFTMSLPGFPAAFFFAT